MMTRAERLQAKADRWGIPVEEVPARIEANRQRNAEEERLSREKLLLMEEAQFLLLDLDRLKVDVSWELRLALWNAGSRRCDLDARRQAVAEGRALVQQHAKRIRALEVRDEG
jgi:hypothetical protein